LQRVAAPHAKAGRTGIDGATPRTSIRGHLFATSPLMKCSQGGQKEEQENHHHKKDGYEKEAAKNRNQNLYYL
jgi:hypothetical protein